MTNDEDLGEQLHDAAEHLDAELGQLCSAKLKDEPLLWLGSRNGGRWLLITWNQGRTLREGPSITLSVWTETTYGTRYPNKNAAFNVRVSEFGLLGRALSTAFARARVATGERRDSQQQLEAERRQGGER